MVRLLAGCNRLLINMDMTVPREKRKCTVCDSNSVESLFHFIMRCSHFNHFRIELNNKLRKSVSLQTVRSLEAIPEETLFYVLIGMDYPIETQDLLVIRRISCQVFYSMYKERVAVAGI